MSEFRLRRADADLYGTDGDAGETAVVFQHGLGGGEAQVAENFPDSSRYRRVTLECRAHGRSTSGSERPFTIRMFADDLLAACDARGLGRFVAGGISMGAALALRLAVMCPDRVQALILVRPAWFFAPAPANMLPYAQVADALRAAPPDAAQALFAAGDTARMLAREAPDNLASLLGFFGRRDSAVTADLLRDIARDGPGVSRESVAELRLPALVIGNAEDHAHPLAYASELAATIPGARFLRVPPRATRKADHIAAVRAAVDAFLMDVAAAAPTSHTSIGLPT